MTYINLIKILLIAIFIYLINGMLSYNIDSIKVWEYLQYILATYGVLILIEIITKYSKRGVKQNGN